MAVDAPPQQLTDFLRSLRAVREFQRKQISELVHEERYRASWQPTIE